MATTPDPTRKLAAGIAAVVLTLGAAGAAVAVNLGTGQPVDTTAGKLAATEPASTPETTQQATSSTIYVDLTVPVPAAPSDTAPAATDPAPAPSGGSSYSDDGDDEDRYESERSDDDHDESSDESSEHEEGSDDDD